MANDVTGYTDLYALLGNPVEHSKSPAMYNYTYEKLGLDAVYVSLVAEENNLDTAFDFIRTSGIKGGNLTMPVKTKGFEYADELTDSARLIGAVNCFKNDNGKIIGHNTDGKGFIENLKVNGHVIDGKKAVLFGVGGAGTSIAVQSLLDGVSKLSIFNIDDKFYERGKELVQRLQPEFPNVEISFNDLADKAKVKEAVLEADFLFDSTKVGMEPLEDQSLIKDPELFHRNLVVSDTVYVPEETKLIVDAKKAGVKAAYGGIGMLLYQGAVGFEFTTGKQMPVEDVKRDVYHY